MQFSLEQLYDEDNARALALFLFWTNGWLEGFDSPPVSVDTERAWEFVTALRKTDFPANGGFDKASPFKKAANLYMWLMHTAPITGNLPSEILGPNLARFSHATNCILGIYMVQSCLEGAQLVKSDNEGNQTTVTIANPIKLSAHFLADFVEASENLVPREHYKLLCLLIEALAYEANPSGLCYEKVI